MGLSLSRLRSWFFESEDGGVCLALLMLCAIMYIPLAGNYGMWDPWETHYGEVARQMLERNDFISQWWPGSPQDRAEFWSKSVLTFWLMALGMKAVGLEWGSHPAADSLTASWRVEWGSRMPFIILSIVAIWSVWELVRRLAGRRAGLIAAVVLATSSQWAFITRQAMTDMSFVAPMTVALALAGLAVLLPEEEREAELPRKGPRRFSWPHTASFYVFFLVLVFTVLVPLTIISVQLKAAFVLGPVHIGRYVIALPSVTFRDIWGIVPMAPYWALSVWAILWCARARNKRQVYLYTAYVMCGLATLAKGPAGLALPAIVIAVYLFLAGRYRDIFTKLELLDIRPLAELRSDGFWRWFGRSLRIPGLLLFVISAFPWYHAMLIKNGMGFWNEFIGDNYVRRAAGRHGDRGNFEYYIQYITYGMFPWSGFVALASLWSFKRSTKRDLRGQLVGFAFVWFLAEFAVVTGVGTKFHHYILPALPALAILAGIMLDELLSEWSLGEKLAGLVVAIPTTFLAGRDLAAFPPRLLWLFNYDYVNMPGTGRPWPLPSLYGDRYEYKGQIFIFACAAALATLLIVWPTKKDDTAATVPTPIAAKFRYGLVGAFFVCFIVAIAFGPATPQGIAPTIGRLDWLKPTVLMIPFIAAAWFLVRDRSTLLGLATVATLWTGFILDKMLIELSPHWSQKHVIASYYRNRQSDQEPLVAWMLYWRGENFYSRNQIYRDANPLERTVFLGDKNTEKLQTYLSTHKGRRVFFVVERARYESLRGILPEANRASLHIVDESNNKLYLAAADI